jgi:hypothetical protein
MASGGVDFGSVRWRFSWGPESNKVTSRVLSKEARLFVLIGRGRTVCECDAGCNRRYVG